MAADGSGRRVNSRATHGFSETADPDIGMMVSMVTVVVVSTACGRGTSGRDER
ncbi:hypothetical protein Aph02nite_80920 [Actinoplanes philippinensis]|nr:hypothetical protein Aph02nite_80920 [Actinoplanes philippinensis]